MSTCPMCPRTYRHLHDMYGGLAIISTVPAVLAEVDAERLNQDRQWGEQNHPDAPSDYASSSWASHYYKGQADAWKRENARRVEAGTLTWDGILLEEVYESLAETDPAKRRAELVQVAAVAVAEIEAIDRRVAKEAA